MRVPRGARDPDDDELASAVRRRLAAAGLRATARQDFGAAAHLLERAARLLRRTSSTFASSSSCATPMLETGRGDDALEHADPGATSIERGRSRRGAVPPYPGRHHPTYIVPEGATERLATLADEALPELLASGDDVALYTVHHARGWSAFIRGRLDTALPEFELAASHARRAERQATSRVASLCRLYGTTTVADLLEWLERHEVSASRDPLLQASWATAHAMCGRFDVARAILQRARAMLAERGGSRHSPP